MDIFRRPSGSYGFEEYRRDPEDRRGWFPIGYFGDAVFETEAAATHEARAQIPWFDEAMTNS